MVRRGIIAGPSQPGHCDNPLINLGMLIPELHFKLIFAVTGAAAASSSGQMTTAASAFLAISIALLCVNIGQYWYSKRQPSTSVNGGFSSLRDVRD